MAGSGTAHLRPADETLLRAENLSVQFETGDRGLMVQALSDVSLDLAPAETLGLVGESGCGKSTLGRSVVRLQRLTEGRIHFSGLEISSMSGEPLRSIRPRMQIILQDPIGSLNPRRTVADIVAEPLRIWRRMDERGRRRAVDEILVEVGLNPRTVGHKKPFELSGGQCQRVSIARALIVRPELLVCDEPTSSLDVSIQAQILNLLEEIKAVHKLALLFISHDLAIVRSISDRVAVMYLGKLCEISADLADLYRRPAHHYTAMLLSSVPRPNPTAMRGRQISGVDLPSPLNPPSGCRFRTRCPAATDRCVEEEPKLRPIGPGRFVACHFPLP